MVGLLNLAVEVGVCINLVVPSMCVPWGLTMLGAFEHSLCDSCVSSLVVLFLFEVGTFLYVFLTEVLHQLHGFANISPNLWLIFFFSFFFFFYNRRAKFYYSGESLFLVGAFCVIV